MNFAANKYAISAKTHAICSSTSNLLLKTQVSILETRHNLLETELDCLRHTIEEQYDPKGKRPSKLDDLDMVFIKTPSIYNFGRSVDIRIQCALNIQGHTLTSQAFLDSEATQSTIDETILLSFLPANLIKKTNTPLVSTQFDGQQLTCSKYVKNAHLCFYTNCGKLSPPLLLNQLWVQPLSHWNIHLILGLNFLLH